MWKYEQSTGKLISDTGEVTAVGYSGLGVGKNNPTNQDIHDFGPIPCGVWIMSKPLDTITHGPYVIPLSPMVHTETFGRTGFLIHGDSMVHPGTASLGCIIVPKVIREKIWASNDHSLQVVTGPIPSEMETI